MSKLRGSICPFDLAHHDRDDPLAVFDGGINFLSADFGLGRVGADEEKEDIGFFNSFLYFPPPIHCRWNALPIDPEIQVAFLQFPSQLFCKFSILARIRDENLCHIELLGLMVEEYSSACTDIQLCMYCTSEFSDLSEKVSTSVSGT